MPQRTYFKTAKKPSKYKNRKVLVDGTQFHSMAEAKRYQELKILERAGLISNLKLQPVYNITINDVVVCKVIGDFEYLEWNVQGSIKAPMKTVVEDVKGFHTPLSRLKYKLVKASYPQIDWRILKV